MSNKDASVTRAMNGRKWWLACDVHYNAGFCGYTDTTRHHMDIMKRKGILITRKRLGKECKRWLTEYARAK